jgi:hypothetical protein
VVAQKDKESSEAVRGVVEINQMKRNIKKEGRVEECKKTRKTGWSKITMERSAERKESPNGWTRRRMWRRKGRGRRSRPCGISRIFNPDIKKHWESGRDVRSKRRERDPPNQRNLPRSQWNQH